MSKSTAPKSTPSPAKGGANANYVSQRNIFLSVVLNMSWQLAIVVLVPVIIGTQLDKKFGTSGMYTYIGLGLALIGSGLVMWRAVKAANKIPVPKLTAAQKRAIKKSYEDEDKDG